MKITANYVWFAFILLVLLAKAPAKAQYDEGNTQFPHTIVFNTLPSLQQFNNCYNP
jgi:hypothetical protein